MDNLKELIKKTETCLMNVKGHAAIILDKSKKNDDIYYNAEEILLLVNTILEEIFYQNE